MSARKPVITDMHCHVLPGVDDGCARMEDSLALLREAARQGVGTMIVTPHFHPGRYKVPAKKVLDTLERLRIELGFEDYGVELLPGQECYYYSGLLAELDAGNVLTMNGTEYVLMEFDPQVLYSVIQNAVRELFNGGYRPIVAHFERYKCLNGRTDRLDELKSHGALLQMNFDRLLDKEGIFKRNPWRQYLREGYVDFLGSDTHGMNFRPLHADKAVEWMLSEVEPEICDRILVRNIRRLTGGAH